MDFWQIASLATAISTLSCGALLFSVRRKLAVAVTRQNEAEQLLDDALAKHHQSEQGLVAARHQLSLISDIEHYLERHAERTAELQALSRRIEDERSTLSGLMAGKEELSGARDGIAVEIEGMRQRLASLSDEVANREIELRSLKAKVSSFGAG